MSEVERIRELTACCALRAVKMHDLFDAAHAPALIHPTGAHQDPAQPNVVWLSDVNSIWKMENGMNIASLCSPQRSNNL